MRIQRTHGALCDLGASTTGDFVAGGAIGDGPDWTAFRAEGGGWGETNGTNTCSAVEDNCGSKTGTLGPAATDAPFDLPFGTTITCRICGGVTGGASRRASAFKTTRTRFEAGSARFGLGCCGGAFFGCSPSSSQCDPLDCESGVLELLDLNCQNLPHQAIEGCPWIDLDRGG